ncbi:MAG: hypothetical protein IPO92_20635 [Saprospiraceae bacterium]|nr:hypothetical protein [Saprospiraceae bacterium]
MKLSYRTWNKEHFVSDDIIISDLSVMSANKLSVSDDHTIEVITKSNLPNSSINTFKQQQNRYKKPGTNNNQNKNQSNSNRPRPNNGPGSNNPKENREFKIIINNYLKITNSVLRFCCLPVSDSLESIGAFSPMPSTVIRS